MRIRRTAAALLGPHTRYPDETAEDAALIGLVTALEEWLRAA
ncbi:MAG: hypothetical protein ACREEJ_27070 [Ensifer adhaerens]